MNLNDQLLYTEEVSSRSVVSSISVDNSSPLPFVLSSYLQ